MAPEPLGRRERRIWVPEPGAIGRRRRQAGPYEVFIPEKIAGRDFSLESPAVLAVSNAARALSRLDAAPTAGLQSLNALAATLLRSESAASSRIEGLAVSQKRLARVAFSDRTRQRADRRAAEVLGNVEAMRRAIEIGAAANPFGVEQILDIHRTLLRFSTDREIAGVIREEQNWIGGNDYNPIGATFVPPPHELVERLLEDLCTFLRRDDLEPIAQAAIAHAQFENIHPFLDGNGRVGRALIYTILRRRAASAIYIPPISLVLAGQTKTYFEGFGSYSSGDVSAWVELFADATALAVERAERFAGEIADARSRWIERLGRPRNDAAVRLLVDALPGQPVIDVATGVEITGRSHVAVGNAIRQLAGTGILTPLNERKWGRVWECDELFELVEDSGLEAP